MARPALKPTLGRAHDRLSAAYVGSNVGFWRGDRLARFRDGGVTDAGQARIDDRIQREQEASRCHRCGKSALYHGEARRPTLEMPVRLGVSLL